jgi:hypothetical protein
MPSSRSLSVPRHVSMCVTVFSLSFHRSVCVCVCVCVCGKSHRWHRPHGSVVVQMRRLCPLLLLIYRIESYAHRTGKCVLSQPAALGGESSRHIHCSSPEYFPASSWMAFRNTGLHPGGPYYQSLKRISNGSCVMSLTPYSLLRHDSQTAP